MKREYSEGTSARLIEKGFARGVSLSTRVLECGWVTDHYSKGEEVNLRHSQADYPGTHQPLF